MKLIIALITSIYSMHAYTADCVSSEFVQDYCYFGLPKQLDIKAVAIEPVEYGYEASTIVEVKKKEIVSLVVICSNGKQPTQNFTRVAKEDRRLLSKIRYKEQDAVLDLSQSYQILRTRLSHYICE